MVGDPRRRCGPLRHPDTLIVVSDRSASAMTSGRAAGAFAFSIFDDTDWTTVRNGTTGLRPARRSRPADHQVGLDATIPGRRRTTGGEHVRRPGLPGLGARPRSSGHEIGFHNATDRSSTAPRPCPALDRFEELFGAPPRVGADHAGNREALYAGAERLRGLACAGVPGARTLVQPDRPGFEGDDPASPYFWGDVAAERIDYWRLFSFARADLPRSARCCTTTRPALRQCLVQLGPRPAARRRSSHRLAPASSTAGRPTGACASCTPTSGSTSWTSGAARPCARERPLTDLAARDGWFAPGLGAARPRPRHHGVPRAGPPPAIARLERAWIARPSALPSSFGPTVPTHADRARPMTMRFEPVPLEDRFHGTSSTTPTGPCTRPVPGSSSSGDPAGAPARAADPRTARPSDGSPAPRPTLRACGCIGSPMRGLDDLAHGLQPATTSGRSAPAIDGARRATPGPRGCWHVELMDRRLDRPGPAGVPVDSAARTRSSASTSTTTTLLGSDDAHTAAATSAGASGWGRSWRRSTRRFRRRSLEEYYSQAVEAFARSGRATALPAWRGSSR